MSFIIPLLALIVGILLGRSLQLPAWGIVPVLTGCIVYFFLLKSSSSPLKALKFNNKHYIWIFLVFFGIGVLDMGFNKPDVVPERSLNQFVKAEGEIIESKEAVSGDQFIVKIHSLYDKESNHYSFRNLKILLYTDGLSASPGDLIGFPAALSIIEDNPNHHSSGYASRMNKAGLRLHSTAKAGEIHILGFNNSFENSAIMWRNRLIAKIEKSSLSRDASNFITALLLGDRTFLSEGIRTTFSNAGVAHVLALSGLHVAIIMGIFLCLLYPLKLFGWHIFRYWISLLFIWGFAFFTGMSPSTVRACLMTTLVIAAMSMQRKYKAENALIISLFIILLISPGSLFDIGLQLSFLCVGGILLFVSYLNPVDRHYHPFLHSAIGTVLVSLVATVTTWVVTAYYFKTVPLLFLPVNLCLLPLLPGYILLAVFYLVLLIVGVDSSLLSFLLGKGYDLFNWIAEHLSAFGTSVVSLDIQLPIVILWLLGIMIIGYAIRKKPSKQNKFVYGGGISLLVLSIATIPFLKNDKVDSIIFQKKYNEITLAIYNGDNETISKMPRNAISRIIHKSCEIMSIDCKLNVDSITSQVLSSRKKRNRYLILGSGFGNQKLKDIPAIREFDKIILHSSIKRKMETKLKNEALELGLNSIYSLRDEGPLEEFLPDSLPAKR